MKTRLMTLVVAAMLAGGVAVLEGCKEKGPAEKAGAAADDAAKKAGSAAEEAGDAMKEATEGN